MIRIFAIDKITGERFEIDDLYWFEEEGVHDFGGEGLYRNYSFEFQIEVNPKLEGVRMF